MQICQRTIGCWGVGNQYPHFPCSFTLPRKIVSGWLSHGDTEVANRARLWDSAQSLVSPNTSLTYRDAFRSWQASVCKILAMATWDSQGLKKTELGLSYRLGAWEAASSRLLEEHKLGASQTLCHLLTVLPWVSHFTCQISVFISSHTCRVFYSGARGRGVHPVAQGLNKRHSLVIPGQ